MKQPKTIFTTLLLAGLVLAACKPGAAPNLAASNLNQAVIQGGDASQIHNLADAVQTGRQGEITEAETQASDDSTQTVESTNTPEPAETEVEHATETPEAEIEDGHNGTPEATEQEPTKSATEPNSVGKQLEFTGTITEIGNGFIVVNGQTVWIGTGTEVQGTLTVGGTVKVHAFVDGNGALSAREVQATTDVGLSDNGQGGETEVGDDNGQDDPATHDVGDDQGSDDQNHDATDDKGSQNGNNQGNDDQGGHHGGDDNGGGHSDQGG